MKILLVEDDRRLSHYLGRYFEIEGWEIERAYAPCEALEAVSAEGRHGIQLIVLDIMMPTDGSIDEKKSDYGQDTGLLLLEKLIPEIGKAIPIVVLTARLDLDWLVDSGKVCAYLQKTMTPEEIVEAIKEKFREYYQVGTSDDGAGR